MCYIRHYNKFSNWYYFTRLQTQEVLFRSPVASSTTVCCTQPTKTSITRCFSLSTSFTGFGIHANVLNPKCFSCVVWCSSFLGKKINCYIADIRCCTSFSLRSAIQFSSWSVVVFINTFKNYPKLFLHFFCEKLMNTLLPPWLLNFYLIFIKIRSYSLNPISWITAVWHR